MRLPHAALAGAFIALTVVGCHAGMAGRGRAGPARAPAATDSPMVDDAADEGVGYGAVDASLRDQLEAFEWRRAHALGRFLSGSELRSADDTPIVELMRRRILGFGRTREGPHPAPFGVAPCGVDTFVNGLWSDGSLDGLRARDLLGVEYYEAVNAPAQFRRSGRTCPVVVLWLRP